MIGRLSALGLLIALAPAVTLADAPRLSAEAGIGRPGRWLPVRITIESRTDDIAGDVVVEWGSARVRRAVVSPAPSRRDLTIYIRTVDVRDIVTVRLRQNGRDLSRLDVPVRVAGTDDRATLTVAPRSWPDSWRGYDAADDVVIEPGESSATPGQRDALALWHALRCAGDADRASPATEPIPTASFPSEHARGVLFLYLIALGGVAFALRRGRARALLLYPAVAGVIVAGSAGAWASGRTSAIVVHHQTIAEQFDGAETALVSMRATAEYPSDGEFAVRADTTDGVIDVAQQDDTEIDADGHPVFEHRAGLGSTLAFSLEGSIGFRALEVTHDNGKTRVANVSSATLSRCELPDAFGTQTGIELGPGQSRETAKLIDGPDPIVECRIAGSPVRFSEPHHPVMTEGTTVVVYHLAAVQP